MWWSDRRLFLRGAGAAALAAALSGCGFRPLYSAGETGGDLRGRIAVAPPKGRLGFYMRERLDRLLGGPVDVNDADFLLTATLEIEETGLAITPDNAITRYRVNARSRFELTSTDDGEEVLNGTVESLTAYSATASMFATRAAERDAEKRIVEDLAERIAVRIAAMAGGSA